MMARRPVRQRTGRLPDPLSFRLADVGFFANLGQLGAQAIRFGGGAGMSFVSRLSFTVRRATSAAAVRALSVSWRSLLKS